MMPKKAYAFPLSLLLLGLFVGLSACSPYAASQPSPGGKPDSVRIQIDDHMTNPKPVVTLNDPSVAQRLYNTIYALAPMPAQQACTDELGPHYTLTFSQEGKTLVTALARRDGCRPVSIAGETQDRQTTPNFWTQLDQAIYAGEPPAIPSSLAVQHTPDPTQSPQTAQITDSKTAQRLYQAILALPLLPGGTTCTDNPNMPEYQLVFQAPQQAIPALLFTPCNSISLEGSYQTRGGVYTMTDQFKQLFASIMAGATFAPARPDHLTLEVEKVSGTASEQTITNITLMQRLYQKVFTLQSIAPQPDCPSEADKVAGKGIWYSLSFSQWSLPILQVSAYEGSCKYVALSVPNQQLAGDQEFWNLVHQAAG